MTYRLERPDSELWSGNDNIAFSCLLPTFSNSFLIIFFSDEIVHFINEKYYYFVTALLGVSYSCCLADPATAKRPPVKTLGELFFLFYLLGFGYTFRVNKNQYP